MIGGTRGSARTLGAMHPTGYLCSETQADNRQVRSTGMKLDSHRKPITWLACDQCLLSLAKTSSLFHGKDLCRLWQGTLSS